MSLDRFHPAVSNWFTKHYAAPTKPQEIAWPAIKDGKDTLIAAPTGSGKTLAAFLAAIDDLIRQGLESELADETYVLYVSPLKALSNDIQKNLQKPLEGIQRELEALGLSEVNVRTLVRTGDTPAGERTAMTKRPPHIVVTTPESLYILLTSESGRRMLKTTRTLIVDEIHALVADKRGSHLALSIERLQSLIDENNGSLNRIGLSATQKPIEEVARYLVGNKKIDDSGVPDCVIVDTGHRRKLDLAIEVPGSPLESIMSGEVWDEVYDKIAELINTHRTTLIFVNTRRTAERVARHLSERISDREVTSHHGSLSRDQRLSAEQRLKNGELKALVATASLELGIDIGDIDLVCQIGSTRSIAAFLQRVGRSGHTIHGFPKGRIFPTSRDELIECAALLDCVRRGELDKLSIPIAPLDILSQQIVAAVGAEEWTEDNLFEMVKRAYPYRGLTRERFDEVVRMLAEGFATRRGKRSAYIHHDMINHRLRGRRGARLAAITSGGAIPDTADYQVVQEPSELVIGTVHEDFAIESLQGDIFQLGNTSWRILRVEQSKVRVEDAHGQPPTIPFWLGEAPARTVELSFAVSRLRTEVGRVLNEDGSGLQIAEAVHWLVETVGISAVAAQQIAMYLASAQNALGVMPSQENIVMERFFDESGGMQLVIHSPFGSRINRAWGLALRKRFCRTFNFELQAAATEDTIIISLSTVHSFPLDDVFKFLHSSSVRPVLTQALLDAPMWEIRWRWNITRALAVLRRMGGRKIPPQLQRMYAEDILCATFPDQIACAENLVGEREIPDHPLVQQTIYDCLHEAMDIDGLEALLASMERGEKNLVTRDLNEPSPLSLEVLSARPYAYLDDAPMEERRTLAVMSRRWIDPASASDIGNLDASAIERVRDESWPQVESADELHDALVELGFLTEREGETGTYKIEPYQKPRLVGAETSETESEIGWRRFLQTLSEEKRAAVFDTGKGRKFWVAAERLPQLNVIYAGSQTEPPIKPPEALLKTEWTADPALVEIVRGRMDAVGPTTIAALAETGGLPQYAIENAMLKLEGEGFVLRGKFTPGTDETEWCARRLLARIHSYTLNRLRQEIEPVSSADFVRFLLVWQKVDPEHQVEGPQSLAAVVDQLEGFESAAAAWEGEILSSRVAGYDPLWLDNLCLTGQIVWARLSPPKPVSEKIKGASPIRNTPIALINRKNLSLWDPLFGHASIGDFSFSTITQSVYDFLVKRGASFFSDIVEGLNLLKSQVEESLGELVAYGLITADSYTGLRALLTPSNLRTQNAGRRKRHGAVYEMSSAGRWTLLNRNVDPESQNSLPYEMIEKVAHILLRRYGVVFRKLLEREDFQLPWRDLLRVFRRLEARGEIRGGRFVSGFSGEQFALPDAVSTLRSIRRTKTEGSLISISAADPLNLVGIITPGGKVTSFLNNRILYRDGVPIAALESGQVKHLVEIDPSTEWQVKNALVRRVIPPQLRSYLKA